MFISHVPQMHESNVTEVPALMVNSLAFLSFIHDTLRSNNINCVLLGGWGLIPLGLKLQFFFIYLTLEMHSFQPNFKPKEHGFYSPAPESWQRLVARMGLV